MGLRNYPHVIRAYKQDYHKDVNHHHNGDLSLDELEEFCRSGGKKYNSEKIRITAADPRKVEEMHNYWRNGGKLPKEYSILRLSNWKGKKIVSVEKFLQYQNNFF